MSKPLKESKQNTFRERAKTLKERDPWFGATFEEAEIRALREAQHISGDDKIKWLEEMNRLFTEKGNMDD